MIKAINKAKLEYLKEGLTDEDYETLKQFMEKMEIEYVQIEE